jgi:hypothetical protein
VNLRNPEVSLVSAQYCQTNNAARGACEDPFDPAGLAKEVGHFGQWFERRKRLSVKSSRNECPKTGTHQNEPFLGPDFWVPIPGGQRLSTWLDGRIEIKTSPQDPHEEVRARENEKFSSTSSIQMVLNVHPDLSRNLHRQVATHTRVAGSN